MRYVIGVIRYRCQRQSARKSEKLKPQGRRCGVTGTTLMWCAGEGDRVNPVRSFLHEPLWGGPSTYPLGGGKTCWGPQRVEDIREFVCCRRDRDPLLTRQSLQGFSSHARMQVARTVPMCQVPPGKRPRFPSVWSGEGSRDPPPHPTTTATASCTDRSWERSHACRKRVRPPLLWVSERVSVSEREWWVWEWVSEWLSIVCVCDCRVWVSEWVWEWEWVSESEWVWEWVSECGRESEWAWAWEWVSVRVSERGSASEWVREWVSEWLSCVCVVCVIVACVCALT